MELKPKEKAKELMQKAYDLDQHNKTAQSRCKQIALLCVKNIQDELIKLNSNKSLELFNYYQDVRKELLKL